MKCKFKRQGPPARTHLAGGGAAHALVVAPAEALLVGIVLAVAVANTAGGQALARVAALAGLHAAAALVGRANGARGLVDCADVNGLQKGATARV